MAERASVNLRSAMASVASAVRRPGSSSSDAGASVERKSAIRRLSLAVHSRMARDEEDAAGAERFGFGPDASVRWALAAGCEALTASGLAADDVSTVFASCGGDGPITHQICEALASATREISPTRFHNSVHNAPAGYWSIATRSHAPSTSLCGYHATFAVGLLEAVVQAAHDAAAVLLIAYDLPYPEPMHALWSVSHPFAAALVLRPSGTEGAQLQLEVRSGEAQLAWPDALPER